MLEKKLEKLNDELERQFNQFEGKDTLINIRPSEKKWSIGQHLYHLWLSESGIESYIRKKTSYPDTLVDVKPYAGFINSLYLMIPKLGIKLKAPRMISDPIPEKVDLKDLKTKWLKSRESFAGLLIELDKATLKKAIFKHPFLGRINMDLTLDFMIFHQRHHHKAIQSLSK